MKSAETRSKSAEVVIRLTSSSGNLCMLEKSTMQSSIVSSPACLRIASDNTNGSSSTSRHLTGKKIC